MLFWLGSAGQPIEAIQKKLGLVPTGKFGETTAVAVRQWQARKGLTVDGIVGPETLKSLNLSIQPPNTAPQFSAITPRQRDKVFGAYDFSVRSDGSIMIHGRWERDNIVEVFIPALAGKPMFSVDGKAFDGYVRCHRLVAEKIKGFFHDVVKSGLVDRIKTYDGCFVPRLMRGSRNLSNHAYGIAFDINAHWNGLGAPPAPWCRPGSVVDLVPIAHRWGFFWGGNFSRRDGMHFEVAKP